MSRGPIFVAGLERSGTSLMFALLASHPNIAMTRRTNMWTYFYNQYGDLSQPDNFERCLSMMMRYKRLVKLQPDPNRIRREFRQGEATYARLFALLEEHYAERLGKPRWGDKSLNTERYADPIFEAYPDARILHMMRDPRDRYASVIKRWKYRRGGIGAGTAMWLSSAKLAQRHQRRYPDRYKIVRYETLAFQPEKTLRELCAFVNEAYSPAMLSMQGAKDFRDEGGNSSYGQRKPGVISTKSIGRYSQVLTKREIAFFQSYAGQEMLNFDYQPEPIQLKFSERLLFTCTDQPLNLARLVGWRILNALGNLKGRPLPSYRIVSEASST
ncbi:MAG: sulfotransferase [Anaerolineae bacterium]|nr:sulfotransferase [Anaerolineae bacterium]